MVGGGGGGTGGPLKSSAEEGADPEPPATRTWPVGSRVAVWSERCSIMSGRFDQRPVDGSNRSAMRAPPPATKTLPVCSNVAVWYTLAVGMLPVTDQVSVP